MMNALGGIVVNKTSVPDNFRQVDTFNTEMLSKLWKGTLLLPHKNPKEERMCYFPTWGAN